MFSSEGDWAFTAPSAMGQEREQTFSGALSFLRRKYSRDLQGVDIAVTGIPFDIATTNRPGSRFGPQAIRAASAIMACDPPYGCDFDPRDVLNIVDTGDCPFYPHYPDKLPATLEAHADAILASGAQLLSLGGDHFVSYPLLKAHEKIHGQMALLHFDAHTDTWEGREGDINHGTMFWHATREGIIDPSASVQVGIRTPNPDTMGFQILDAPWVHEKGTAATIEAIRERVRDRKVYLTFDIDCLDPAYAPGTGTPVSGGLTSHQALEILRGLKGIDIVGADIVEVAPAYDVSQITAIAAAHIAYEFLVLMTTRPGGVLAGRNGWRGGPVGVLHGRQTSALRAMGTDRFP